MTDQNVNLPVISGLQSQIDALNAQINALDAQRAALVAQMTDLDNQRRFGNRLASDSVVFARFQTLAAQIAAQSAPPG